MRVLALLQKMEESEDKKGDLPGRGHSMSQAGAGTQGLHVVCTGQRGGTVGRAGVSVLGFHRGGDCGRETTERF